ncbi:MFS transporter [Actinomadura kijaniata]|uniref:MFS transporter n=1 Tax=Actinomadura namibiensis TaxID=182080 RepID=A0A7W3LQ74_ACTNM|nr:MFS transporter [Actinomadura namibiensis]MBA8952326.1 hypothetical protein [Actinomadura namibiensis]
MGTDFSRLWTAYAVSAVGSAVATDVFAWLAVTVLAVGAFQVSLLMAVGGAFGALLALPLGPWVEFRRKRPLLVGADLARCAVLLTVPVALALDALTYVHLLLAAVLMAVGQIVFVAASGPHLRALVPAEALTAANARFESVQWTSSAVGPPVGGLLVSALGPAASMLVDAASYLLSAVGVRSLRAAEPAPPRRAGDARRSREIAEGWRIIRRDRVLWPLFLNTVAVSALIMAVAPVLAVLMLRELRFTPFQYGLSVGVPCVAGVVGARVGRRLARRNRRAVLLGAGVARVLWMPLLPLAGPGWGGLALIIAVHTGTVLAMGMFNPIMATYRLERAARDGLARVLTAWSVTSQLARAGCVLSWGLLATLTAPRVAMAAGALLLLATALTLPWRGAPPGPE